MILVMIKLSIELKIHDSFTGVFTILFTHDKPPVNQ